MHGFSIKGGAAYTRTTAVTANNAVSCATQMRFSTNGGGSWTAWETYAATKALALSSVNGTKTVLGEFRDAWGNVVRLSDTIVLDSVGPLTLAPTRTTVVYGRTAALAYRVNDALSPTATVTIKITRTLFFRPRVVKTLSLGRQAANRALTAKFDCRLTRGTCRFLVYATDLAGNVQRSPIGANTLTVR